MKTISFVILISLMSIGAFAQIATMDQVIGATGGSGNVNSNFNLSWSVGEAVTFTASSVGLTLTQGFLQPVGCVAPVTSSISPTVCESYLSPSGKTFSSSGIYLDTIPNSLGCDSIITINLTVLNSTTSSIFPAVCNQYISPSGQVLTSPGTFTDTIPNATGCDSIITINLTIHPTPAFTTANVQSVSCFGGNDGQISLNPASGVAPIFYSWAGPVNFPASQQSNRQNLKAGQYVVTMIDGNGCVGIDSFSITEPSEIMASFDSTDANCGAFDGAIDLTAGGGTGTLTYQWNNGASSEDIDSLPPGLYVVTIRDQNACAVTASTSVGLVGGPVVAVNSVTPVSCHGGNDGAIDVDISGTFQAIIWSNGFGTEDISNLQAGPYQLTVADTGNCNVVVNVNVPQPDPLDYTVSATDANCNASDASATVIVTGGNGSYSYVWSNGSTSSAVFNLSAGVYSVTVTDNQGCSLTKSFTINEVGAPQIVLDSVTNGLCGATSGSIEVTTLGNPAGFTYSWDNGSMTEDLLNVPLGTYNLTVTAPNSCQAFLTATVAQSASPAPEICVVTVDSALRSNQIVWERGPDVDRFDHYNIWRESTASGVYQFIGTRSADSTGLFTDTISNPLIKSYRYKISVVDTCGLESPRSSDHKTIHLIQGLTLNPSNGVFLVWDAYEGFPVSSYTIFRAYGNNWDSLTTLAASSNNSFTDIPPVPRTDSTLYYAIITETPNGCDPTKGQDFNRTRSNNSSALFSPPAFVGLRDRDLQNAISIYPNPANDRLYIEHETEINLITILDIHGKERMRFEGYEKGNGLDIRDLASGMYMITINSKNGLWTSKFIKE